jgi:hypothetical protein
LLRSKEHVRRRAAEEQQAEADQRTRFDDMKKAKQAEADEAKKNEQANQEKRQRTWREGDISDASTRYTIALGKCYNIKDPYTSLAETAAAEGAAFAAEQQELRRQAALEQDPHKRHEIDLRRQVEACEYMSFTSTRLAGICADLGGGKNAPLAKLDRERAATWENMATQLREERVQHQQARDKKGRDEAEAEASPRASRPAAEKSDRAHEQTDAKAARRAERAATNATYAEQDEARERAGGRGGR